MYIIMWPLTLKQFLGYPIEQLNAKQARKQRAKLFQRLMNSMQTAIRFKTANHKEHFQVNGHIIAKP